MSEQQANTESKEISKKNVEAKRQKEYEANRKALAELCELYPEVFNTAEPKPLKIGIHEAVAEDGKLSKTRIRRALNLYVRMRGYVACLTENAERVTLGGKADGVVTAEEASHAAEKLAEIDRKRAERKATQDKAKENRKPKPKRKPVAKNKPRPAAAAQKSAKPKDESPENAEQRMQAKLAALVNKRSN